MEQTDIRYLKGVGEARAKTLNKLGIHTLHDLVSYFPRAYEDTLTCFCRYKYYGRIRHK